MQTQLSVDVSNWINKVVEICGDDTELAQILLATIREGFYLPSENVIPPGPTRDAMHRLLCSVAGYPHACELRDTNLIQIPKSKKSKKNEESTPLLPVVNQSLPGISEDTKFQLNEKIKELNSKPLQGASTEHTESYRQMCAWVLNSFLSKIYDISTQSAYQVSKWTPVAILVSTFSSMATFALAYKFWTRDDRVAPFWAVVFAGCAYVLNFFIVVYWSIERYKQLTSTPSIFAEKSMKIDVLIWGLLLLQTIASSFVSPYLFWTMIPSSLLALKIIGTIIVFASPMTSNWGINKRIVGDPVSDIAHAVKYYHNPKQREQLMKRLALEERLLQTMSIFPRLDNFTLNTHATKLLYKIPSESVKKTDIALTQLLYCEHVRYQEFNNISWFANLSLKQRMLIATSISAGMFFIGYWAGVYYRRTGGIAGRGIALGLDEVIDPNFNSTTWRQPPFVDAVSGVGAIGSWTANAPYYITPLSFVVDRISAVIAEWHSPGRFFTNEHILSTLLFCLISIAPTVAAVELANSNTDPLYVAAISVPILVLMNFLSLVNIFKEILGKGVCPGNVYEQDVTMSARQQNHIANRQLFLLDRFFGEVIRHISHSNLKVVSLLYDFLIRDSEAKHGEGLNQPRRAGGAELQLQTFSNQYQNNNWSYSQNSRQALFSEPDGHTEPVVEPQNAERKVNSVNS